jgi:hypothetical protein
MNHAARLLAATLLILCAGGCASPENQAKLDQAQLDTYARIALRKDLDGQVLAVNRGYNFVVINIGSRQGAQLSAEMLLTRGARVICKVHVISVEPSACVADILPATLRPGVHPRPGDGVLFPRR